MYYRSVLLLTLLLYLNSSFAQNNNYSITHYTTDQGLPQNSIKSINFDKAGYCWLGTEMGLVRFDGVNFKVFGSENIKGLLSDRLGTVARDTAGNTYAEMDNSQQMVITIDQSGRAPFPKLLKGRPMCFSGEKFLSAKSVVISQTLNNLADSVRNSTGILWMVAPNGSTYIGIEAMLYYVQNRSFLLLDTIPEFDGSLIMIQEKLVRFMSNGKIRVWQDGVLQTKICSISGPLGKSKDFISGSYNLLTSGTGVYVYSNKTIYRIDIKNNQPESEVVLEDIDIPDIHSLYYHRGQQRYYIGTLTSGLYIVEPVIFHYPQIAELAINLGFRTQVATKEKEGLICEKYLYRRDGTFEVIPLRNRVGYTMYYDSDDGLNYGTGSEFFRFKFATQQTSKLFDLDGRPITIIEDKTDNCMLISTGLSVVKLYRNPFKILKQMPGGKEDKAILGLIQTGKDSFLLATQKGLKWYDWAHNRIFHSTLDSFSIYSIYAESTDRIWISTYGKGFFLYNNGKVHQLPYGPFNALKSVHSFVDDGRGCLWLPTNNGLYKVRKDALLGYAAGRVKEVYYYSFTTHNGLRSNEFNGGSMPHYVWLKDNMLSLLSIKGPVWFYPNNIKVDYPDKHIYVDQLEVNNSVMLYPGNGHISLEPDFENITLTVSSPYFGNKENQQLKYKIEGIGMDWQPVAANGKIQLNRVPSGDYRLIVRKLTGREINQYNSLMLSFTVKPWFYNTWWFYTALFCLLCCAAFVAIKLRTRLLMERNRKLQHIIEDRTGELKASNLMKENLITMVLHDLRSPIKFLQFLSKNTAKNYDTFNEHERKEKLIEINTSVGALNDFTEQFFSWAVSQRENFRIQPSMIDLQLLFDELTDLYGDLVTINNNQLLVAGNDSKVYSDKNILSAIIRNLLDNANKNTKNGTIFLESITTESGTIISITDTGNGLTDSQIAVFYGTGLQTSNANPGYGQQLIPDLLKKIDGKLDIESKIGTGTRFQIFLSALKDDQ